MPIPRIIPADAGMVMVGPSESWFPRGGDQVRHQRHHGTPGHVVVQDMKKTCQRPQRPAIMPYERESRPMVGSVPIRCPR